MATTWLQRSLMWLLFFSLIGCTGLPDLVLHPHSRAWAEPENTWLGQLASRRQNERVMTSAPLKAAKIRSDSGFYLLNNAADAFSVRLALIDSAQHTVDIQSYAIHADDTTDQLIEAMRRAVARGVRIRILLDDFNTTGKDAQVLALAFVPGIELRLFNPLPGTRSSMVLRVLGSLKDLQRIQRRMHNKIFVADNAMAIAGGRNLGDTYFAQNDTNNFVDLDVLAAGPIVQDLSASFDLYWNNRLAYPAETLVSPAELEAIKQLTLPSNPANRAELLAGPASATPEPAVPLPAAADLRLLRLTWAPSVMLVDKPSKLAADAQSVEDAQDTLIDGLLHLVSQAKRDLLIVSPYFVPGQRMMTQLAAIRQQGVRIRVLTNSLASNDAPAAHVGYARYRPALLAMGVELYELRAEQRAFRHVLGSSSDSLASLHSKLVVVDEALVVIGSMNLDLRSQLQNTEVALAIRSRALAQQANTRLSPTLLRGAWRLHLDKDGLLWQAPQGSGLTDTRREPDASLGLRLLVRVLGPFAPDEML